MAPLVGTRSFWRLCRIVPVEGCFVPHLRALIWDAFFVWGSTTQKLPLGEKLSPKVTDEGAILYPTFPCRKIGLSPQRLSSPAPLGESIALHPPQCAHWGTFPRGRLWAWEGPFPSARPPLPARPAGGRAVTGVGQMGRRPGRKKEDPRRVTPNQSRESRGENLSPLALFPPVSREKRGPRRVGALRGAAPRGTGKAPTTRRVRSTAPLTGAGREPPK